MTTLVRLDPLRDITVFRNELDRVFGRGFGDVPGTPKWSPAIVPKADEVRRRKVAIEAGSAE